MNLREIREQLAAGRHPRDFGGQDIGSGIERTAYRVGVWVVKSDGSDSDCFDFYERRNEPGLSARLAEAGIRTATTYRVGHWEIQPYYKPLINDGDMTIFHSSPYSESDFDTHENNVGFDLFGRLVAFDW